jgi:glycosyltransferase involved in cell wall biosynthesis
MRVAMIGQKGIPARYGGIERHVDETAQMLAERGHEVFVYCRPYYTLIDGEYKGVNLIKLPSIKTRHLDAASHTIISTGHVLSMKPDIVHYHALGPSALSFVPRVAGARTVVTIHGLDWRGGKWGRCATWLLKRCEYAACNFPNRAIVVSRILKTYFEDKYGREVVYIPNGVRVGNLVEPEHISKLGLSKGDYYLFVGRFGPEKGCHMLIEAFSKASTGRKLAMVGSAHLNLPYADRLRSLANEQVVFTGEIYGDLLTELWSGAYAVIHPSMSEGMSLSLLEAMAHSRCTVVSDIPENLDVVGDTALTFKAGDISALSRTIEKIDVNPDLTTRLGAKAVARVKEAFDWSRIVDSLERVYLEA